jgi:hypothetical protein
MRAAARAPGFEYATILVCASDLSLERRQRRDRVGFVSNQRDHPGYLSRHDVAPTGITAPPGVPGP